MNSQIIDPIGSRKVSRLLAICSLDILKTVLLLHEIMDLIKYVQWYDVTSLMPAQSMISGQILTECFTRLIKEKPRFEMNTENK